MDFLKRISGTNYITTQQPKQKLHTNYCQSGIDRLLTAQWPAHRQADSDRLLHKTVY